jgi:dTDP-glucose 4,6-dehydratase
MSHPLAADLDHVLTHTPALGDDLRGARLFLTGGTGFFGTWLLESFLWANDRLALRAQARVLTRDPDAFRRRQPRLAGHPAITLHAGDVRSFAFPEGEWSHVIHAATPTVSRPTGDEPVLLLDTILRGTRRTLDFARQAGARRALFTSSGAVYGRQPSDLTHIGEDYLGAPDPTDPGANYGEGKRAAEQWCALYRHCYGLETTIARCFAFVGPHLPLDAHFAVGNFLGDGLRGGPIRVGGDGTPYRSYLHAADLMIWLWTILLRGQPGRPYNVGSDQDVTIADLARRVAAYFRVEVSIARPPVPGAPPQRYVPATGRAAAELGLKTWIALDDAIERTASWHRAATAP